MEYAAYACSVECHDKFPAVAQVIGTHSSWNISLPLADLGPISVIFMQFLGKIWLNEKLTTPLWGWHPLRRLGNPGSATDFFLKWALNLVTVEF